LEISAFWEKNRSYYLINSLWPNVSPCRFVLLGFGAFIDKGRKFRPNKKSEKNEKNMQGVSLEISKKISKVLLPDH
jgi:hypothetical protein